MDNYWVINYLNKKGKGLPQNSDKPLQFKFIICGIKNKFCCSGKKICSSISEKQAFHIGAFLILSLID
jgi:hypothetical protein